MGNYAWCTDVHFDSTSETTFVEFGRRLTEFNPDGIIITGDISVAPKGILHLSALEKMVQRPVYFVLGNHDFYGGSVETVRKNMKEVSNISQYLKYLPNTPYVSLTPTTALIGHDGWYDAGYGNWKRSSFGMADWVYIQEFAQVSERGTNYPKIVEVAQKLAREATMHVHDAIKSAARHYKNIVIATHVPPFAESHMHEGKQGDAEAMPWFTSKMMGDMLMDASRSFPDINFTVLAGHTHGKYDGKIAKNLIVRVGGATYGRPQIQDLVNIP